VSLWYAPNHMNRLPIFISLQYQNRLPLGIILYQDCAFQSTHYLTSSQTIVRKFAVSMLGDPDITRYNKRPNCLQYATHIFILALPFILSRPTYKLSCAAYCVGLGVLCCEPASTAKKWVFSSRLFFKLRSTTFACTIYLPSGSSAARHGERSEGA
jgi:cytosine/uracil/thiamine/allantoin permease